MSFARSLTIAGVAIFLILLLARLPAALITAVLPPSVSVSSLQGSFWRGSAGYAQVQLQGKWFALGRVSWRIKPLGLLVGDAIEVKSDWGKQSIAAAAGASVNGDIHLSDVALTTRVDWIRDLIPLYIAGELKLTIVDAEISADGVPSRAEGRIVWENAAWQAQGGDVSLGTYAIDLTTGANGISGDIVTLKGALELSGQFNLDGNRYAVKADLSGAAVRNEAFQQAIALMAVPTGSGYRIDLSGTL